MLDLAVAPTFPSTVLGYTKIGKKISDSGIEVYEFLGHTEKPDFKTAKKYVESGDHLWHANYYMWTPRKFLEAFEKHSPAHFLQLKRIVDAYQHDDFDKIKNAFNEMEKISFDYAVTEKIDPSEVLILRADFGWNDVGAFDVLYDAGKAKSDEQGNLVDADFISRGASGNLIIAPKGKLVAAVGIEELVVVDTKDALLVCLKSKAQEVKKIVEELNNQGKTEFL